MQLSEAIDLGLATLSLDCPEGWREGGFIGLVAWLSPECPELEGEGEVDV